MNKIVTSNAPLNLTSDSFLSDLKSFNFFYENFSKNGLLNKYNEHLDLGGAEAFFGYLCQVTKLVKNSTSIDPLKINESIYLRLKIYYKFLIKNFFSKLINYLRFTGKNGYVNSVTSIYNNLPIFFFRENFKTCTQNIFKIKNKYDFISSIGSLEYFNPIQILKHIYKLLNKDGVVYINVSYHWYLVNFKKKSQSNFTLLLSKTKKKYEFLGNLRNIHNGKGFNVEDFYNIAKKIGYEDINITRNIPSNDIVKKAINNQVINDLSDQQLNKICKETKKIKNVTIEDFKTLTINIILKK